MNNLNKPKITPDMLKSVSPYRREMLEQEVEAGLFSDGRPTSEIERNKLTANSYVTGGISKRAQVSSPGGGYRGSNDSPKQAPDIYSPLWLTSNLSLPRDRATINAWCRSFFALNGMVQNAITLHSTYPISKLNIKCKNKEIEKFFSEMSEELDLMNICVQIAQEFWLLGEAFPYLELDESTGKWSRIVLQNPDYISVKRSNIENEPLIMLKPDENLKKIITSGKQSDIEQRKQLDPYIIECVKKGQNIPLDNLNITMLARKIAPYEVRGTGLPVSVFRQLMLFDKIRECYDEETQVLTEDGFKFIYELLEFTESNNNIVGLYKDKKVKLKDNIKIACYDKNLDTIKYLKPKNFMISNYSGEMLHFKGNKIDIKVTPNHKMLFKEKKQKNKKTIYSEYLSNQASYLASKKTNFKFKSIASFEQKETCSTINILGKELDKSLYLKVLGYVISEGCVYKNYKNKRYDNSLSVSQAIDSDCYEDIKSSFNEFANNLGLHVSNKIVKKDGLKDKWIGVITNKNVVNFFIENICGKTCKANDKKIPREIFSYEEKYLKILLNSLVKGDGTENKKEDSTSYSYCTISKQLSEDVYELVYKCGYVPNITEINRKNRSEYYVTWSDTNYGNEPVLSVGSKNRNGYGADIIKEQYNGIVWCFETDTGYFVTKRNNKATIQGNCKFAQADDLINPLTVFKIGSADFKPTPADIEAYKNVVEQATYDKNFKLFTHDALDVQVIGRGSGIYDTSNDITQLIKEIYTGLMVPSVIMDGGSDTTYSNGGVALDVLRQRYMQFRNMLASWLKRKVFTPIAMMQDFYEYTDGRKKTLIVPEVDWNHMSLFDTNEYINNLMQLSQGAEGEKRVAVQELHRALGLDFDDQMRKIRKETIANEILKKEKAQLEKMSLNELRALTDEDEIQEKQETMADKEKLPGEVGPEDSGGLPGMPPMPDMPDLGGAPPPEPPK